MPCRHMPLTAAAPIAQPLREGASWPAGRSGGAGPRPAGLAGKYDLNIVLLGIT